ncbi:hypothetical protein HDU97_009132 [Phlyctochytrium planicorne]|nr:hypothetical protein HDU97_009132 [Phlyctochytrium planicorne]
MNHHLRYPSGGGGDRQQQQQQGVLPSPTGPYRDAFPLSPLSQFSAQCHSPSGPMAPTWPKPVEEPSSITHHHPHFPSPAPSHLRNPTLSNPIDISTYPFQGQDDMGDACPDLFVLPDTLNTIPHRRAEAEAEASMAELLRKHAEHHTQQMASILEMEHQYQVAEGIGPEDQDDRPLTDRSTAKPPNNGLASKGARLAMWSDYDIETANSLRFHHLRQLALSIRDAAVDIRRNLKEQHEILTQRRPDRHATDVVNGMDDDRILNDDDHLPRLPQPTESQMLITPRRIFSNEPSTYSRTQSISSLSDDSYYDHELGLVVPLPPHQQQAIPPAVAANPEFDNGQSTPISIPPSPTTTDSYTSSTLVHSTITTTATTTKRDPQTINNTTLQRNRSTSHPHPFTPSFLSPKPPSTSFHPFTNTPSFDATDSIAGSIGRKRRATMPALLTQNLRRSS